MGLPCDIPHSGMHPPPPHPTAPTPPPPPPPPVPTPPPRPAHTFHRTCTCHCAGLLDPSRAYLRASFIHTDEQQLPAARMAAVTLRALAAATCAGLPTPASASSTHTPGMPFTLGQREQVADITWRAQATAPAPPEPTRHPYHGASLPSLSACAYNNLILNLHCRSSRLPSLSF